MGRPAPEIQGEGSGGSAGSGGGVSSGQVRDLVRRALAGAFRTRAFNGNVMFIAITGSGAYTASSIGFIRFDDTDAHIVSESASSLTLFKNVTIPGTLTLSASKTPSSASDTGTTGEIAWDSSYIYICIATDTWQRAAHATW